MLFVVRLTEEDEANGVAIIPLEEVDLETLEIDPEYVVRIYVNPAD